MCIKINVYQVHGYCSNDIPDIQNKQDIVTWNKYVRIHEGDKGIVKIGSLDQNLIKEGTHIPIAPASKESELKQ